MIKMRLELDRSKIIREGIVGLEDLENALARDFSSRGICKDEDGFYVGDNFGGFAGLISSLWDSELFLSYVSEWKLYDSDMTEDENEFFVEDILAFAQNGLSWRGVEGGYYTERSAS